MRLERRLCLTAILGVALVIPAMGNDSFLSNRVFAMRDAIREQALGKGFQCDGC